MTLLLILFTDALSAVRGHFTGYPNDGGPETPEHVREMAEVAGRFALLVPKACGSMASEAMRDGLGARERQWACLTSLWLASDVAML